MRWFKHLTDTRKDEKIAQLIAGRNGIAAYGLWWAVLETVAGQIEKGSDKCSLSYPVSKWAKELLLRPCNLRRSLAPLVSAGLVEIHDKGAAPGPQAVEVHATRTRHARDTHATRTRHARDTHAVIELRVPNLLKYRDEWQSRLGSHSGARVRVRNHNIEAESDANADSTNISDSSGLTDLTDFFYTGQKLRITREEHEACTSKYPGIDVGAEYPRADAKIVKTGKQRAPWATAKYMDSWLKNLAETKPQAALVARRTGLKFGDGLRWDTMSAADFDKWRALPESERGEPYGNFYSAARSRRLFLPVEKEKEG